jgi:hypothetical protein
VAAGEARQPRRPQHAETDVEAVAPAFDSRGYPEDVGSGRRAGHSASRATTASSPHGEAQAKGREDRRERVEARIAALRESSIERLSGKTGLARERSHAAHRFGYGAESDGHGACITILEHRFNVGGDLGLALQVIGRSERAAWACGRCSLSSTHELVRYPLLVIVYRHRTAG